MTSRLSNSWPIVAALFFGVFGCEGLKLDGDAAMTDDTRAEDTVSSDVAIAETAASDVSADIGSVEQCVSEDDGSPCEFLDGEVVLKLPPGALGGRITLTLEKKSVRIDGQSYVGYVWGPHGHPVEPAAEVVVTSEVRASAGAKLALGNWSGDGPIVALPELSTADGPDGTTILTGRLGVLETLVVYEQ